ncbi:MAG: DUF3800 domain-containing protein [Hyphomicrobiaceae bacterium]
MRCRLYIDEVGNSDLHGSRTDDNIRYLSLTGVIAILSHHDRLIQPALDALKEEYFGHTKQSPIILHRKEIINQKGPFRILKDDTDLAERFSSQLLGLLETLPYLAITVTIDKRAHLEKYEQWHFDPYHYCVRCIVERYVMWLRRHSFHGDVAAEPRFPKVDKKLKASFTKSYEDGTEHIPAKIVQAHLTSREIKMFPKAANSAGLQLADMIAHPSFRAMKMAKTGEAPKSDYGSKIEDVLVRRRYARDPTSGAIDGWGRKWLP